MRVIYAYADDYKGQAREMSPSIGFRCEVPASMMVAAGHQAALMSMDAFASGSPATDGQLAASDLVVVQRRIYAEAVRKKMRWLRGQGVKVLVDIDDGFQFTPRSIPAAHCVWRQWHYTDGGRVYPVSKRDASKLIMDGVPVKPPAIRKFKRALEDVDGLCAPSEQMCRDWGNKTKVYYLPNAYDPAMWEGFEREEHEGVVVGWQGSRSHLESWEKESLFEAMGEVAKRCPEARFAIAGDRRVFDRLPVKKKEFVGWVPFRKYPEAMASFDVGLAPLGGAYDERRSDIKIAIDYPLAGVPWVASDFGPYRGHDDGFLVKRKWEWVNRVCQLVRDELLREEIAEAARKAAKARSMGALADKYIEAYREVLDGQR